jgi:serine/threonine-protein kinase
MPQAQQLGRYQLLDRIAFGGMAEIFRAKTFDNRGRARMVAVKRVLNHLTTDDDFIRMLVDEAKVTASLRHENIARVYEFAHTDDEYFIAMEYVDGKDVRSLLERHRQKREPIPPEHVAWIAMHVAEGLNAAHTQRDGAGRALHIVHRDVSPSNVLIAYQGQVKLCDFGIAKATLTRVQTRTGVIKGKVKYMSPEQAMGRKLDHRSDLFSLGTVMYEMLTLEAPFVAATEIELIFCVRDARKKDARELAPGIPEELNKILNKLMSRPRSERYQSGQELAMDLRRFLERHRPGYKRGAFSRFMREIYAEEIDKELRMLEEWVISGADPSKVGTNLIADALGANAPFSQFTAAQTGPEVRAARTNNFPRIEPDSPTDLHGQPTMILARADLAPPKGAPGPAAIHQRPTYLFDRAQSAEIIQRARSSTGAAPKEGLHEQKTVLLSGKDAEALHALATRVKAPPPPPSGTTSQPPPLKREARPTEAAKRQTQAPPAPPPSPPAASRAAPKGASKARSRDPRLAPFFEEPSQVSTAPGGGLEVNDGFDTGVRTAPESPGRGRPAPAAEGLIPRIPPPPGQDEEDATGVPTTERPQPDLRPVDEEVD